LLDAGREDAEAFLGDLLRRHGPGTAAARFKALRSLYRWLEEEGRSPTTRSLGCAPLTSSSSRSQSCRARRSELLNLHVTDVNFDYDVIHVLGKGGRQRAVPFGRKTAQAVDRYLRVRSLHKDAAEERLWLGKRGPWTDDGLRHTLRRRGEQAGIPVSTHTSSAIPSPTPGSPRVATRLR
jgi:integrase